MCPEIARPRAGIAEDRALTPRATWQCANQTRYFSGKMGNHDWHAQWRVLDALIRHRHLAYRHRTNRTAGAPPRAHAARHNASRPAGNLRMPARVANGAELRVGLDRRNPNRGPRHAARDLNHNQEIYVLRNGEERQNGYKTAH